MYYSQQSYISLLFKVAYTVDKFLSAASDIADVFVCNWTLAEHAFYNIILFMQCAFLESCLVIRFIAFTQFHKFHLQLSVIFYFKDTFMDLITASFTDIILILLLHFNRVAGAGIIINWKITLRLKPRDFCMRPARRIKDTGRASAYTSSLIPCAPRSISMTLWYCTSTTFLIGNLRIFSRRSGKSVNFKKI